MYEIEKGIPVAGRRSNGGAGQKYPFVDMQPGDSVFIPEASSHDHPACRAARAAGSRKGFRVVIRFVDGGARVWRDFLTK